MSDTLTGLVEIIINLNDQLRAARAEIEKLKSEVASGTAKEAR